MPNFDQILDRLFERLGWNEPEPETPPTTTHTVAESPGRRLYTSAPVSTWGTDPDDPDHRGWRSFLHGLPPSTPLPGADEEVPRPNRRKRPALVGLTAFPTPRGLLVAHGGKS